MYLAYMISERSTLSKAFVAVWTLVRFLLGMHHDMVLMFALSHERFPAHLARIRPYVFMSIHVVVERRSPNQRFSANRTHESFFLMCNTHVSPQSIGSAVFLIAKRTLSVEVLLMNVAVGVKIRLQLEPLPANLARESNASVGSIHVYVQGTSRSKLLIALSAFVLTLMFLAMVLQASQVIEAHAAHVAVEHVFPGMFVEKMT